MHLVGNGLVRGDPVHFGPARGDPVHFVRNDPLITVGPPGNPFNSPCASRSPRGCLVRLSNCSCCVGGWGSALTPLVGKVQSGAKGG